MRTHLLTTSLKWTLSLGLVAGLAFVLFLVHARMEAEREGGEGESQPGARPQAAGGLVELEEDEAERYGLETETARPVRWYTRVVVHGRVIPNPQATAEVHSPFAGTLRTAPGCSWPMLGQRVKAEQALGRVDVRVGPEVRLDLQNKLSEAEVRQKGAEEEVRLQQDRVNSLKSVTSQQIISRAELDAALVQLAQAKNQLATARAAAELWQRALREIEQRKRDDHSPWSQPLIAPADGEVTELPGRPGMTVEAGSAVLVLVDFRRPLVRLDIPPEVLALGGPPQRAEVRIASHALPPLGGILHAARSVEPVSPATADLIGPAPRVDVTSQLAGFWYRVRPALPRKKETDAVPEEKGDHGSLWRPGVQVTAEVRAEENAALPAVAVPAGAVLYHEGRPLVYVRVGPEKFQRREVRLLGRDGDRWIVSVRQGDLAVGVTPDEAVVSRQAQVLLSKEFLAGSADND